MRNQFTILMMSALFLPFAVRAAQSTTWDTANNTVTYSDSIETMALEGPTQTINLSQFNAATVAAHNGGNASEYTLTKVILSIDGSISGVVKFENESPTAAKNVVVRLYDLDNPVGNGGWSQVSFNGASAVESYQFSKTFPEIAADSGGELEINVAGTGKAFSENIESELGAYIGANTIAADVDFQGEWSFSNLGNSSSKIDVYGDAVVSVSYTYDYTSVPEPTSAVLLGIGLLFLSLRRRAGGPPC